MKVIKGLGHTLCEERLRDWDCLAYREGCLGILLMYINTWNDRANRMETDSFQWCLVTGQDAEDANWHAGGSIWTSGKTFYWEVLSTDIGFPWRLWSLCPWGSSKRIWTLSWAACLKLPCFKMGFETDDLQRSLVTSSILWFCCIDQR